MNVMVRSRSTEKRLTLDIPGRRLCFITFLPDGADLNIRYPRGRNLAAFYGILMGANRPLRVTRRKLECRPKFTNTMAAACARAVTSGCRTAPESARAFLSCMKHPG